MEEKKDKYKLLRNSNGIIVFHGDEEKREYEIEIDEANLTREEYSTYLDSLKKEADK